jgi:ribosomal protein L11 methyltransferase
MQIDSNNSLIAAGSVRENVVRMVTTSSAKITPLALEKRLFEKYELNKKQIKSVIRDLVAAGELSYTYEYGSTYLGRSFAKAVRISKHVVLQPPEHHYRSHPNDVVVKIKPGASFGAGNHPTTRLAIKGIEFVLLGGQVVDKRYNAHVLDIGTGSGVLLITAILCGLKTGLGIDIDACARVEAAENVQINGLEDRVVVSGQSLADIRHRFPFILANLRYPSLKKMLFQLNKIAEISSFLIISGIKEYELDDLVNAYKEIQFKKIWAENELGWAGVVLRRRN